MITFLGCACRAGYCGVFSRNPLVRDEAVVMLPGCHGLAADYPRPPPRPALQSMIPAATSMPTRPRPAILHCDRDRSRGG